jgi:hypothetical protein
VTVRYALSCSLFYFIGKICDFTKNELKSVLLSFWIFSKKLTEQIDREPSEAKNEYFTAVYIPCLPHTRTAESSLHHSIATTT